MKELIQIGILLVFVGMILIVMGALSSVKTGEAKTKIAVGGFIGPFPFGFANDKTMLYFVIGLSAFMFLVWILFYFLR